MCLVFTKTRVPICEDVDRNHTSKNLAWSMTN